MFHLRRYFSIASLIGVVITVGGLSLFYRQMSFAELERNELRHARLLTDHLMERHWAEYEQFIERAERIPAADLARSPVVQGFRYQVVDQLGGHDKVVKLKLYALDGTTLFSTDPSQLGESEADNPGFRAARAGGGASAIIFRNRIDGFEGVVVDRNLASVYLPVRMHPEAPVRGVLEIYTDVTELVGRLRTRQWQIVIGVSLALAVLYLFLLAIVNRAQAILEAHDRERRAQEAAIRYQAYHDPLTGLPNRAAFSERVAEAVARALRSGSTLALLFFDLDHFKEVNDTLGHGAGDRLLQAVARRVRKRLRDGDLLFRMGGDEFTVLAENLDGPEQARRIAERILAALDWPLEVDGHELAARVSIGIALCPQDRRDVDGLLRCADAAMYAAKAAGRGTYRLASSIPPCRPSSGPAGGGEVVVLPRAAPRDRRGSS